MNYSLCYNWLCDNEKMKHLCESLHVDDVDQSEEEGKSVLHFGHVGQQAALGQNLHH